MKETLLRSISKSLIFFLVKILIAYSLLGDIKTSIILNIFILIGYFINERIWSFIKWGYKK